MNKYAALEIVNTGIVIVDRSETILFWNREIEKISGISRSSAIGQSLATVCPKFKQKRYQSIVSAAFTKAQSRFCSGVLHKSFFSPPDCQQPELLRHNLNVDPIKTNNEINEVMLQFSDITDQVLKEAKLKKLIAELEQGYQAIKESEQAANMQAQLDPLTGIFNRHGLDVFLSNAMHQANQTGNSLAALFVDLDGFKNVNDTYGHLIGDALLQQVCGRLKGYIRYDRKPDNDCIARIGGDEFVIILVNIRDRENVVSCAERIIATVRKPFFIDNHKIFVTSSVGASIYPDHASSATELIDKADQSMYYIKQTGKNNYQILD